jgi:putative transposase
MIRQLGSSIKQAVRARLARVEHLLKHRTRPMRTSQVAGTLADLKRSKGELIAENMFLRQQVIVLERQVTRPRLTQRDRQLLVLLASRLQGWREALFVVKPETLMGWRRQGFRLYWRRKSRGRPGRPPLAPETVELIEEMAIRNRLWRAKRIQGELLKLGTKVSKATVQKYMRRVRKGLPPLKPSQSWAVNLP